MPTFDDVEAAVKTALGTALTYVPAVETYAGQLEDVLAGTPVRFPFVGVFFSAQDYEHAGGPTYGAAMTFTVVIAVQGFRGQEALRKGVLGPVPVPPGPLPTLLHGAYEIIADVLVALANQYLSLDIEPIVPVRVENVLATKEAVAYSLTFRTAFDESFPQG
jgi:phage gp37-like protein